MKIITLMVMALCLGLESLAQSAPVKIVFDVTSKDEQTHQIAMRHVEIMAETYPESEFEVVIYGAAYPMVMKENSTVSDQISRFENSTRVSFVICEASLRKHQIDKSQLLNGVKTVPDGILEIVTKQGEGWGYIKEAHD